MVSLESTLGQIAEARGDLLSRLQDGDHDSRDFSDWADEIYEAIELLQVAMQHIDRARGL
jgi:hypothetical protein